MRNRLFQTIGFILTLATFLGAGYWISWNSRVIGSFVAQAGGIGTLVGAIVAIAAVVFILFYWPQKWSEKFRTGLIAVMLLAAWLIGAEPIRAAFTNTPWLALAVLAVSIIWLYILYTLTILGRIPLPNWIRKVSGWIKPKMTRKHASVTPIRQKKSAAS